MNSLFESDIQVFLEKAEERGVVEEAELDTLAFEHDLDADELGAVRTELAAREVEITPPAETTNVDAGVSNARESAVLVTTDSLTLFMNEVGRHDLLTAAEEVGLAK
ncbi:MAG: hypothetical protein H0V58_07445, partial [Actinobacteria bacterium]|nr:hypothetical protein [Actinomycetota bacterium]